MSKPGLAFGLNVTKKGSTIKPVQAQRRPMFGDDDDEDSGDGEVSAFSVVQKVGGVSQDVESSKPISTLKKSSKVTREPPKQPPKLKAKAEANTVFGDLSSSLASRKNAEEASKLDASVYEYDNVYDSFKPKKEVRQEDAERKPKYMQSMLQAAEVRKRDALIAEEKKIAREREAEGDEYEGKEKFVTEAYKKQQEENKRIEEEEKRREEAEAKMGKGTGMSAFYRKLLNQDEERHSESVKAAEKAAVKVQTLGSHSEQDIFEDRQEEEESTRAKDLQGKGISVDVNEDGQIVDKRQLLRGGLNIGAKKQAAVQQEPHPDPRHDRRSDFSKGPHGRKQAMRERQSQMLAEQLEQSMKRSLEDEESQRQEVERAAKSRKTEGEISSAKERYLARKKAAEEAKEG